MKTLWMVLIVMNFGLSGYAKDLSLLGVKSKVVKTYLAKHYPDAKYVHQRKISDSIYHVHFIHNNRKFFLDITSSGKVVIKEKEMHYNEVPRLIKEYINNNEALYEYGVIIERVDGKLFYYVEIHEGNFLAEYLFDASFNVLKRDIL